MQHDRRQRRDESRVIIHFDYDAFYASVVENENPALRSVPLAIQQKQIVVTCNYEARRRGLRKLQLITEAKRVCPDVVIVLGEDLTRFRNASKDLCNFLRERIWSDRVERLGFDEVWCASTVRTPVMRTDPIFRLDCTDMIDYNYALLNERDLEHSFFCTDIEDPTQGFEFDARETFGPTYPADADAKGKLNEVDRMLHLRCVLGSHLARYLRHELESQRGYTATVGVASNKTLSKLVGNVNKPKNQTTLIPVSVDANSEGVINRFMDAHDIGKVPGVGFKLAQKIRSYILGRDAAHEEGLVYGGTKENVTVRNVRLHESMGPDKLEEILGGPGSQKGIGGRIWGLLNGDDTTEVARAKRVPSQISQEDSYPKYLYTFDQVQQQLFLLAERLIRRMHIDLMEDDEDTSTEIANNRRWLAHPRTLRLTTRPRPPVNSNGTRVRSFNRISHSGPMPNFVLSLTDPPSVLADKLVDTTLTPMFRKLHPERNGWNLSLINIAATNMAETAADTKESEGRDISRMFRRQEMVLKDFKTIESEDTAPPTGIEDFEARPEPAEPEKMSCSVQGLEDVKHSGDWLDEDQAEIRQIHNCRICGLKMPSFAKDAHIRFHSMSGTPI